MKRSKSKQRTYEEFIRDVKNKTITRTNKSKLSIPRKKAKKASKKRDKLPSIKRLKIRVWELCKLAIRKIYGLWDSSWICFTCGKTIKEPKDAHTSHFIPSSICGAYLRYDLRNLRITCYNCNINLGGNGAFFHKNLVKEKGQEYVDQIFLDKQKTTKLDRIFLNNKIAELEAIVEK